MKKSVFAVVVLIALSLAFYTNAWGIKASAKIVKYRQPDGSFIPIRVFGDEFFGYCRTLDNYIVSVGPDGYLYYADYDKGSLTLSGVRVGGAPAGVKGGTAVAGMTTLVPQASAYSLRQQARDKMGRSAVKSTEGITLRNSLVLLVQFADLQFTIEDPVSYFNALLNEKGYSLNGATGSAADYFNANFRGTCEFSFDIPAPLTLSREAAYYGEHTQYMNDANVTGLVVEACKMASENGTDFSKYDTDNDGVVDNVAIIFAGLNEAESGNSVAVWPHKGDIADRNIFCNGVKIASYTCSSEYSGDALEYWPATIGSFCHEFSHSLGLVDMYDVNGEEEGLSSGLHGNLSIMDQGNYLNNGNTPPYFNAIELEMLGLVPVADLCPDRDYTLHPVASADTLYRASSSNPGEYFLFECRNSSGWDKYIGGEGLVVYHIDKSENMCGGLSANARWRLNIVNSYALHECAGLLSADAVFYPGGSNITSLTSTGEPSFTDWQHSALGISIAGIEYSAGSVNFSVNEDLVYDQTIPLVSNLKVDTYHTCAYACWSASAEPSGTAASWTLMLEDENGPVFRGSLPASETGFLFGNLQMGKSYRGKIYMVDGNSMGEVRSFEFVTDGITSNFPYVKLSGSYKVGDILNIFVQNLVEEHTSIEIRLDGARLSGNSYEFEEPGTYELEVIVRYPDRTSDVITKTIQVRN